MYKTYDDDTGTMHFFKVESFWTSIAVVLAGSLHCSHWNVQQIRQIGVNCNVVFTSIKMEKNLYYFMWYP